MTYRLAALLVALALAPAWPVAADDKPPGVVAYVGATLINGGAEAAKPTMVILTRGAQIIGVQPLKGFHADKDTQLVDIHGKYVIPGLINTHVHLATFADPPVAHAYLRRELFSGVTSVRDMAGDVRLLAELKREAEFDEIPSPDIYYVALMAGPDFFKDPRTHDAARGLTPGDVAWMRAITAQTDLSSAVAAAKATGATAIKIYADLPADLVTAITAEAHRQHMLVWAHATVFPAQPSDVVAAGVDVVSHACLLGYEISSPPVLDYHDKTPLDRVKMMQPSAKLENVFAEMKRRGTILDATMFAFEPPNYGWCSEGVNTYMAHAAYEAGVEISAGTDDDPEWKDADSKLDTEIELLVHKVGMTPAQALRSATLIGARTLGLEKEQGTVAPGKVADFVVLEQDPLKDITAIRTVSLVVKHGLRYPRSDYKPAKDEDFKKPASGVDRAAAN
jgi:imidazolonepropionase-like amidohydrolase